MLFRSIVGDGGTGDNVDGDIDICGGDNGGEGGDGREAKVLK